MRAPAPAAGRPARAFAALAFAVLLAAPALAGTLAFSASVDPSTVGLGEEFQLVLTVQGEDMLSVPSPSLPAMPDFNVLGRSSSQSTNISFINGQMRKQATVNFIFVMSAKKLGTLVIPPAKLTYQGRDYATQPVEVTVTKAAQGQAAPAPGGAGGVPAARSQIPVEGNLLLLVTPGRRTVYVGEPIPVELALASRFQIGNGGWAAAPSYGGFWAERTFEASQFDFQRRTIDGKPFGVSVLEKVVLIPLSAGDRPIPAMTFNAVIAMPPRDFFDFGRQEQVAVASKPVVIHVLPLPDAGRPASFTGGVGRFTLDAALDRTSTNGGEPVNLVVRIAGTGNLRMIEPPALAAVPGVKILAPEIKDDAKAEGESVRGTRTFRFPVLPQGDGRFELPRLAVAYFDPQAKAYRTLEAGPFTFSASGAVAAAAPVPESSGLRVLGSDIRYIKPDAAALAADRLAPPAWPNALYALALALVAAAIAWRRHADRLASDRGYARLSRSAGLVKRRLRDAERRLRARDEKGFHAELARAVLGYAGDRFDLDTQALTREQLRTALLERGVAAETLDALADVVDRCEFARFSPGAAGAKDPQALFDAARAVMGRL